ncbi:MAG: succinate dehydrogenase, cytochrome b556 subunit [Rubrimonas sp.]
MADVNRGNRPLSPHLQVYKLEWTMVLSISHRIAGVGLTLAAVLICWWLLAAATDRAQFEMVDGLLTSWFGTLILIGSTFALWYHFCNGVRHLLWDAGYGFDLKAAQKSGKMAVAAAVVLSFLTFALV